jgi:hypothetical protein
MIEITLFTGIGFLLIGIGIGISYFFLNMIKFIFNGNNKIVEKEINKKTKDKNFNEPVIEDDYIPLKPKVKEKEIDIDVNLPKIESNFSNKRIGKVKE